MKHRPNNALILSGTGLAKGAALLASFLICIFTASGLLASLGTGNTQKSFGLGNSPGRINTELLYRFAGWENHYFASQDGKGASPKLANLFLSVSANIKLDDPRSLLGRELPGFYLFDGRIAVAGEGTNYTNMPIESAPPIEIMRAEREAALQNLADIPSTGNGSSPAPRWKEGVFIYFSHNRESYLPYLKGEKEPNRAYHSKINVTQIGDVLKSSLEARGIGSTVDKTDINNRLLSKKLGYEKSYSEARNVVKEAMATNKELLYYFDIHRDSHRKKETTKLINGASYAKLAFVIGGDNPNFKKNEQFATELHELLEKNYKGLSRGVVVKKGKGTNGKYNQDLSGNAILIEFGGVDNTFEELNRSAEAFADVFADYFWQAESVEKPIEQPTDKK
ncbi:stage II sporulation protein P [Bacillus sp. FJAT-27245]|uniref:stage II sporulation protein P n=1 Tax=Bacillus sp. FJAT-27245 TaxID=1684144 RepID=UPI0006A77AA1|nr:stage II sporulation protein P [Bacillus sp. FJAT-27245]